MRKYALVFSVVFLVFMFLPMRISLPTRILERIAAILPFAQDEEPIEGEEPIEEEENPPAPMNVHSLPLMFIENAGQFPAGARFQVRGANGTIWLTSDTIWITVLEPAPETERETLTLAPPPSEGEGRGEGETRKGVNLKLTFPGANPNARLEAYDRLDTVVSYFVGDPATWRAEVPVWGGVRYVDLYPGVDLVMGTGGGQTPGFAPTAGSVVGADPRVSPSGSGAHTGAPLQWRLVARPGAEASAVRLRVEGMEDLVVEGNALRLSTIVGELALPLPLSDRPLKVEGIAADGREIAFDLPRVETLTPADSLEGRGSQGEGGELRSVPATQGLLYSTFLGGSDDDYGYGIAVDGMGNAYVTGYTWDASFDFPTTPGAYDSTHNGSNDALVAKLNPTGSALVYSTFLGGGGDDRGYSIAVDGTGNAYVTGQTADDATDFPTTAWAFDTTHNGNWDAFAVKLNPSGSALLYSTFLGGSDNDYGHGIAVDGLGNTYVTGFTKDAATDWPTTGGGFDTTHNGGEDVFVTKLNPTGSALLYSTFLGGDWDDKGYGITVDGAGCAYVTGYTLESAINFPITAGAYDTTHNGGCDIFVAKLNQAGSALLYATFLGGGNYDFGYGIAVDGAGCAYVTGSTEKSATDFPTTVWAFDTTHNGGYDVLVTKLNPTGSGLTYSTFLGGDWDDWGYGIVVDGAGCAYVTGRTGGSTINFPTTPGAYDTDYNGGIYDSFVAKLNAAGANLAYSTFLGGGGYDEGYSIAVDRAGCAYVTGYTQDAFTNLPTTAGAFDTSHNGGHDAFVTKLNAPPLTAYVRPNSGTFPANQWCYFTAVYTDADGYQDIHYADLMINTTSVSTNNCVYVRYDQQRNRMYLRDKVYNKWLPTAGKAPGRTGTASHDYVVLDFAKSAVQSNGDTLIVVWALKFKSAFAGTARNVYLYVEDGHVYYDGWNDKGDFTVTP